MASIIANPAQTIALIRIHDITETPENWTIYQKPSPSDPEFVELTNSIRETGINTPLEISADGYILSGHRRYLAAIEVGLSTIPVIIDKNVHIEAMDSAERIALLTERNRGTRVKSDAEQYLEAAARIDPDAAVWAAQQRKTEVFNKAKGTVETVKSKGKSRRTDPSKARKAILSAVMGVLDKLRAADHLPTSSRHIHYHLLPLKVRTSSFATGYIYGTKKGSAGALSKLLTDARSEGIIDPDDINDDTRPTQRMQHDGNVASYVARQIDGLFKNYFSNIHADQPNHVELLIEKNTLYPLLFKHVAHKHRIPISSMKGYGSFPVSRDIAGRFRASGKERLVIIYASDLDPEGVDMPSAVKKYLKTDFGVEATVVRAAVTMEQVRRFNLPPDADVKVTSSRAAGFKKQYGSRCWELDSMPTEKLIAEVSKAATNFLEVEALNKAFEREKQDDIKLARMNAAVAAFVRDQFRAELKPGTP